MAQLRKLKVATSVIVSWFGFWLVWFQFCVEGTTAAALHFRNEVPTEFTDSEEKIQNEAFQESSTPLRNWKWEGLGNDIRLTEWQKNSFFAKSGLVDKRFRWPGGKVVYNLDPNFEDDEIDTLNAGMFLISSKTCIQFVERTNENDYVQVHRGGPQSGCFSQLGRVGGSQDLNLGPGCLKPHTVAHEFIHALGFYHEHNRPDRDDFITINWQNVQGGKSNPDLAKVSKATVSEFGIDYDYLSIMHYDELAYTKNRKRTIVAKKTAYQKKMGSAKSLTELDAQKINKMYEGFC